jgi:membrane-associated protease RseP (regulator of RpoE activity)
MVGLYSALIGRSGTSTMRVIYDDHLQKDLVLKGAPIKGVLIASVFNDSGAFAVGVKARSVLYQIDGDPTPTFVAFRSRMNSTHPGQEIEIATTSGSFKVKLGAKADGTSLIGVGISPSDALYVGGVTFQEFPASQFLDLLKAIPVSGMQGLGTLLGLPFVGVPGFTDRGFPGFSGWITNLFEPVGWAKPLGNEFFWIANLLLWIGWIDLYAGLFNCLPAVPLDGGHIFRDLVQGFFERVVGANAAARWTRTVVAFLAWTILTSLLITIIAPFTHGLSG